MILFWSIYITGYIGSFLMFRHWWRYSQTWKTKHQKIGLLAALFSWATFILFWIFLIIDMEEPTEINL